MKATVELVKGTGTDEAVARGNESELWAMIAAKRKAMEEAAGNAAFACTVRGMRRAFGVPEGYRLPVTSPLYTQPLPVRLYTNA